MSLLDFRDLAPGRPAYHALLRRFVLIGHPTDLTNKVGLVRNVVLIVQSFLKHGFVEFLCLVGRIKADLGFLLIFLLCFLHETWVHARMLVVLPADRRVQVLRGRLHHTHHLQVVDSMHRLRRRGHTESLGDQRVSLLLHILPLHPPKTFFLQPASVLFLPPHSTFFSSLQHVHRKHRCSFTPFPNKITHSHRPVRRQYGMHPLEKFAVCIWPVDMTHVAQIGHAKRTPGQLLREVGGHACNHLRLLSQMLTRNRYYICTVHQCRIHPLIRKTKRHVPNGTTNIQHGLDRNRPSVVRHPIHHLLHHLGSALSHSEHKTAQIP